MLISTAPHLRSCLYVKGAVTLRLRPLGGTFILKKSYPIGNFKILILTQKKPS